MSNASVKTVQASQVEMTELVLPQHINQLGNLMGGQIMHWMDICAAMAAIRHTGLVCVTAAVDEISFFEPIRLGDMVILKASVNRTFHTSIEVGVKVLLRKRSGEMVHSNTAYFTFVGLDDERHPAPAAPITPESDVERRRFDEALFRRNARLEHRRALKQWKEQKR